MGETFQLLKKTAMRNLFDTSWSRDMKGVWLELKDMIMDQKLKTHLDGIDEGRRDVIKRLILGSAFAIPAVATYALSPGSANAGCFNIFASNTTNLEPGPPFNQGTFTATRKNLQNNPNCDGYGHGGPIIVLPKGEG